MRPQRSEDSFDRGLASMARGDYIEALACFEAAMAAGGRAPDSRRQESRRVAALSYYGLSLALASDRLTEARDICEAAVEVEPDRPDLYLNLGRVCQRQGDRAHAFRVFVRGLRLDSRHQGLVEALRALGFRRRPVVTFLPRHHPVNRLLGSLRAALHRRVRRRRPAALRAA